MRVRGKMERRRGQKEDRDGEGVVEASWRKRGFSTEDTTFVVVNERKFRGNLWDYEYFSDEGR